MVNEKELLKEAKRRFPIGCEIIPAHVPNSKIRCKVTSHDKISFSGEDIYLESGGNFEKNGNHYNQILKYHGKWAEITNLPIITIHDIW